MIIFYEKESGKIVGTIEGRVHHKDQLAMWIGDKNTTDRIIIEWTKGLPDHTQPDIIRALERDIRIISKLAINPRTKLFISLP